MKLQDSFYEVRRRASPWLARLGIKEPVRRGLTAALDAFGIEHDLRPVPAPELAHRIIRRSTHVLSDLPALASDSRILFFSGRNYVETFAINDGLLAWALRLRGADPQLLLCDVHLTACELATVNEYTDDEAFLTVTPPSTCSRCFQPARDYLAALKLPIATYGQFMSPEVWQRAQAYVQRLAPDEYFSAQYLGINIGEQVQATTYRTLLRGTLSIAAPFVQATARRLLINAVVMADVTRAAFEHFRPDCVVAHHGLYLTGGIPCEYARMQGIQVVTWSMAYRRHCSLWSHGDTYHRTIADEPTELWRNLSLTRSQEQQLDEYLSSHWKAGWDWISYNLDTSDDAEYLVQALELDRNKPIIGLFGNIQWDARLHYPGVVFPGHAEWLIETVRHFIDKPHVQIVIRAHPAEVKHSTGWARERADEIIYRHFPELPPHIKVIPADSDLSSYALAKLNKIAVVYGTKLGIEIATRGVPVVVAGDAWYRGKGFTLDPASPDEYFTILEQANDLPAMTRNQVERVRKYAYHFFFRRMIPFPSLRYSPDAYVARELDDLLPGRNADLDVVCDGILNRSPFVVDGTV